MSAQAREGAVLAGRFEVVRQIGAGGMGVVYEAIDRVHGSRVALKTIQTPTPDGLLRLKNEFRALQDLDHPNLVSLGELIEAEGLWFFTMELVAGVDLLAHVRPGGSLDEGRLRAALRGLAQGVQALHHAGLVHRDIKPSNLLVTPDARVVLLDLGLVTGVAHGQQSTELHVVGTVAYMAPEQAASLRVGPPADWYSVGVLLYEALTGRLPFIGAPLEILMNKQKFEPAPPRAVEPSVPPDLDALCIELLRFDPEARPRGREILARLGATDVTRGPTSSSASLSHAASAFVGRGTELDVLDAAFEEARRGSSVALLVEGESGVGKSLLVRRFTEALPATAPEVVVLAGRCYERESVPYKAFDGVIDALSRYMMRLSGEDAGALLPRQGALLAQVFPVLRRVKAFSSSAGPAAAAALDPQELRTRLFGAVRELLGRLADRHRLVVVIDDLQWADHDSLALLAEALRPPEAPALFLVATLRTDTDGVFRGQLTAQLPKNLRWLTLGRLSAGEARELAEQLLAHVPEEARPSADAIAAEAAGHPLFIDELARFAELHGQRAQGLRLDEALLARVAELSPDARTVIELVAVAGTPLPQDTIARAAAMEPVVFGRALSLLRAGRLVRTTGGSSAATVEPYHDRVREAVAGHLAVSDRQAHHRELALALETSDDAASDVLAVHWQGAGDAERAASYALRAAAQAEAALAFDRAARLCRMVLDLRASDHPDAQRVRVRLGAALANAGRGAEAAEAYLASLPGAEPELARDLQRRAAEQLLRSGHFEEGIAHSRSFLAPMGVKIPRTPRRAIFQMLLWRIWLRLRGLRFVPKTNSQIRPEDLTRIDFAYTVAMGLQNADTVVAAALTTRMLLLALEAGEPRRVVRSLAFEAGWSFAPGGRSARGLRILEMAGSLAAESQDPEAGAFATAGRGMTAFLLGRFREALPRLREGQRLFREKCNGKTIEMVAWGQIWECWTLYYLGELAELGRRSSLFLREARDRGDLLGMTYFRTAEMNVGVWLCQDDPSGAREAAEDAMNTWTRKGFDAMRWGSLHARIASLLYCGEGEAAYRLLLGAWTDIRRAMFLFVQFWRVQIYDLRGRCALSAALSSIGERHVLLADADRFAGKLQREKAPSWNPLGSLLQAGVARQRGEADRAVTLLRNAGNGFLAADMALHAHVANRRLGELLGGDEGRALVEASEAWMRDQGIKNPERWAAMLAPAARK